MSEPFDHRLISSVRRFGVIIRLIKTGLTCRSRGNTISSIEEWERLLDSARQLASRLERLSADSIWAHRASGLRGSLLKKMESLSRPVESEYVVDEAEAERLEKDVSWGYTILEQAARELFQ